MQLPEHIHPVKSRGKVYLYFQKNRSTPNAGPRTRIPYQANTAAFWSMYEKLNASEPLNRSGSINDLIAQYQQSARYKRLKPNSKRDYDYHVGIIGKRLGDFDAVLVTPQVVQTLYDSFANDEGKPVKARKVAAMVRTLFAFGVPRGFAKSNPAREVDLVEHKARQTETWPTWAIQAATFARWEVRTFAIFARYTGQRTSDIVRMGPSDIRGNLIRVVTEKVGLELWIPIHRDLLPTIVECRQRGYATFLHGPTGKPMTPDTFRALFDRSRDGRKGKVQEVNSLARFKSERITPHGPRRNAVINLLEAGVSEEDTGLVVGMSVEMVRHYGKGWDSSKRTTAAMRLLEASGKKG